MTGLDFAKAPLLVIWEVTRSCALACRHCRAEAEDRRDPLELDLPEGKALIDDIVSMGTPLVVFSGGDPLQRDDLEDLIAYARSKGLRVGTIPAATPRLTRERLLSLKHAGVHQVAFSLDDCTKEHHDRFRQVEGSFDRTVAGATWAREMDLPLQINTVFGAWNWERFDQIAETVERLGVVFWEVFFLVEVGRGSILKACSDEQSEILFSKLHGLAKS